MSGLSSSEEAMMLVVCCVKSVDRGEVEWWRQLGWRETDVDLV
jgi:hypothetical protein